MNILILFGGKYPGLGAASKRVSNYRKSLKSSGNNVEILSVFRACNSHLQGMLYLLWMPFYSFQILVAHKNKPDILFVYSFGWISKLLITIYCRKHKIKIVFELNEKPYSIVGSKRDYILKYFYSLNNWFLTRLVYPRVDGFVVISENLCSFVARYKSARSRIVKIPILVDFEFYQVEPEPCLALKPFILHSATLNDNKDGIFVVFEAIAIVIKEFGVPLHFYLTSELTLSSIKEKVDNIIKTKKISGFIHFLGDLDDKELLKYQSQCNMVVINKVVSEQNIYNFATKIGEYSALGKPIITTGIGEVVNYFKDNVNCLYVPPNNPRAIAEKIAYLLKNPDKSVQIGAEARKLAYQSFDYKQNSQKLNSFMQSLFMDNN